ncbi:MAG: hypothetical protein QW315_00655 [Candidatus Hadarchaeum sp.]
MPKCCKNCYLYDDCENRNECCEECDFYSDGECTLAEDEWQEDI